MKGYYISRNTSNRLLFADRYSCDHQIYSKCTLYKAGNRGLAVIQQRFNSKMKMSWWGPIDPWLANDIFEVRGFAEYFERFSGEQVNGIFPTVEVRKLMYALHMKPMRKEIWETPFRSQFIQGV